MIQNTVGADIVSLQEAVTDMADGIVGALNARGGGSWALANAWGSGHYWCGLHAYRSDKFYVDWHREVGYSQDNDQRGICGALFRRKSDDAKACVWGTHPVSRD